MSTLLIALLAGVGFIVAYHTYGRWLGGRIFRLSADAVCPSERLKDGVDYVPTSKSVVFGHHFTSIAGTGPIVGPAIAIMWGWVPALLWVVLGSIFIGAVHDFGALVVSLRNNGQTVGDIAGRVLNKRVRLLFLLVLFMALTVVLAIFGLVIAAVFKQYPAAIFPCVVQIPIAVAIGVLLHRKGVGLLAPSLIALGVMYFTVVFGNGGALGSFNSALASWPIWTWVVVLLVYSYIASVLPVWTLLQPRDYINSLQLITALALIVLGLVAAAFVGFKPSGAESSQALEFVAPAFQWHPEGAPMIFPFLFITIACGAVSGFHCLVSSGTSSKQLKCETDARFVGYGSMLTEGFLATLVILACGAGLGLGLMKDGTLLTGEDAWQAQYASWSAAGSLGAKVGAFVNGSANFLQALGLSAAVSVALMGVLVASFAGTTLDTACRLQRYVVQELAATLGGKTGEPETKPTAPFVLLQNKHGATIFAVVVATIMAVLPSKPASIPLQAALYGQLTEEMKTVAQDKNDKTTMKAKPEAIAQMERGGLAGFMAWMSSFSGKGGMILWPLFGATNQLLAGLSFLVVTFYLWRRGRAIWFLVIPMVFMLVMPLWAMIHQLFVAPGWLVAEQPDYLLGGIGLATVALEIWMIVEAIKLFPEAKDVLEENALDRQPT